MILNYIDTAEKLVEICHQLADQTWVAIDTEFMREKTYYPKFCLLQLATTEWVACIDPIAIKNLTPLLEILYRPSLTKVFHACRQDLEIFYQLFGEIPQPIFDTQLAAPLLGIQENPGYAMLVSYFLNINLNKTQTRTDWSIRPLTNEQLLYAADDVIYLGKIYQIICQQLRQLNRLEWLNEDFNLLTNPQLYQTLPDQAWLRIKGKNKLTGRQLSIVQALTEWREYTAQITNRPRNWLLRDELIFELAKLQPITLAELSAIRYMDQKIVQRYGNTICQLIETAKQQLPKALENISQGLKKTPQQEAILDVFTAVVRIRAEENALNPIILASRKELEKLLAQDPNCQLLQGWRYSMIGKELQGLLSGKYVLTLMANQLHITASESG